MALSIRPCVLVGCHAPAHRCRRAAGSRDRIKSSRPPGETGAPRGSAPGGHAARRNKSGHNGVSEDRQPKQPRKQTRETEAYRSWCRAVVGKMRRVRPLSRSPHRNRRSLQRAGERRFLQVRPLRSGAAGSDGVAARGVAHTCARPVARGSQQARTSDSSIAVVSSPSATMNRERAAVNRRRRADRTLRFAAHILVARRLFRATLRAIFSIHRRGPIPAWSRLGRPTVKSRFLSLGYCI